MIETNKSMPATVLLVEDSEANLFTVGDYLREVGYRVREARTAEAAIRLLTDDTSIHVVFSDIRLGDGLDGFDLARWAKAKRPDVKIILATGAGLPRNADASTHDLPIMKKPYTLTSVEQRIRQAVPPGVPLPSRKIG